MSNDLNVLFPGRDVEIRVRNGRTAATETVFVAPFSFAKVGKASGLVRDVFPALQELDGDVNVLKLIHMAHGPVMDLLALCIDRPVGFFDSVLPDDGIKLVSAMIEENHSFFTQHVAPQMAALTNAMAKFTQSAPAAVASATSPSSNG